MAAYLPIQQEFEGINIGMIYQWFQNDINATIGWCRDHGLLARSCRCAACNEERYEGPYIHSPDEVIRRCSRCRKTTNICKGSFFLKSLTCHYGRYCV